MKNKLREFDKRSKNFLSGVIVLILTTYSLDCVLMLMAGRGSSHNKPGRKGALGPIVTARLQKRKVPKPTRKY